VIREANIKDIEDISKIVTNGWKTTYRGIIDNEYLDNLSYLDNSPKIEKHLMENKIYVHENCNSKALDGIIAIGDARTEKNNSLAEIYSLYVNLENRGKKIGTKLIECVKENVASLGKKGILVYCLAQNKKAINFYEKTGARPIGTRCKKINNKDVEEVLFLYSI